MARDGSSGGVVRLVTIDSQGVEKECVLGRLQLFHAAAFDAGPHQFFFFMLCRQPAALLAVKDLGENPQKAR
jgi:hypothetical protein